jgi:superfamily II RNA helicase
MTTPGDVVAAFARTLPFDPDPFQHEAMLALARGESVLVTAPTGAGKTLIADFAAFRAMASGRKLIYTPPLKVLSNQKYRQLVVALEVEVEQLVLLLRETCALALQRCYLIGQLPGQNTGCVCERLGLSEHAFGV